ncbi:MAG TPA: zinc-dependent alcohol dehydrogenase family protein [Oceanipulchritudo sp.]|nr:zinc-dependent alcohol dehydrogenase family protein [Oceanipulchritudo sp.]
MKTVKTLSFAEFGRPLEVLELGERNLPDPEKGEVQIRILAAPIHPSDFGIILGKYGNLPELPAIGGREGVGEVVALGEDVKGLSLGDRVVVPKDVGSWQQAANVEAGDCFVIPEGVPLEMAAMIMVNPPTAWRLLRDAHLANGDWLIQNAANSAVGLHVIEMARYLDLKTINVVRREELVEPLKARGADVVVLEESGYEKKIADLTGGEPVRLALNSVGGSSAIRLVKALSPGGLHITFGAMTFDAVRLPTRELIFEGLVMKGFWMDKWFRENTRARVQIMFDKMFDLMQKGIIQAPVEAEYSLDDYKAAIEAAGQPRLGKILFRFDRQSS